MTGTKEFNHRYIIGISFISALGGYLFGFDFAVISGALPFLRTQFSLDPLWEGFLTGSLALGCIVGCLIAGKLSDRYGRRPGLMTAAVIFAVSSLAIAFTQTLPFFILLRFAGYRRGHGLHALPNVHRRSFTCKGKRPQCRH